MLWQLDADALWCSFELATLAGPEFVRHVVRALSFDVLSIVLAEVPDERLQWSVSFV